MHKHPWFNVIFHQQRNWIDLHEKPLISHDTWINTNLFSNIILFPYGKVFPYFPIFPGTRISVPNKHARARRIRNQALSCLKRHGIINNQIYLVIKLPVASVYFLCNNCKSPVESFKARLTLTGPPIFSLFPLPSFCLFPSSSNHLSTRQTFTT